MATPRPLPSPPDNTAYISWDEHCAILGKIREAVKEHGMAWCAFAERPSVPLMDEIVRSGAVLETLTADGAS